MSTEPIRQDAVRPLVIAHRGASAYRPENTPEAFALAIEQRCDMIETDLHFTRDREIAICHDADLGHLGADGEIGERNLAEVRSLDAGHGQSVPTLDEVLDGFGHRVPFNLEIKQSGKGPYEGLEARSFEAVRARGLVPRTLFSSFYDPVLAELRRQSVTARVALLLSPKWAKNPIKRALALSAEAINPHFSIVDDALVKRAHDAGLRVYVYTVDPVEEMERLLAIGVDGLFTNRPDVLRGLLDAPGSDSLA